MGSQDKDLLLKQLHYLSRGINPLTNSEFIKGSTMLTPELVRCLVLIKNALHEDCERSESKDRIRKLNSKKQVQVKERKTPKRHGLRWTDEETLQAIEAFNADIHPKEIAKVHKRKVTAIVAQLEKKGLIESDERESYL